MILQAVIGGLAGIGVAFKAYRARRAINKAGDGSDQVELSEVEETTQPAES
jgi:hypothetical protein